MFKLKACQDPIQALYAVIHRAGLTPNNSLESVTASQFRDALEDLFFKVGDIKIRFSETSDSNSWLLLDGSSFDGTTYPLLEAFLGSTTLPDFRVRVPVGQTGSAPFESIGDVGGASVVSLQLDEMPAHTHDYTLRDRNEVNGGSGEDGIGNDAVAQTDSKGSGEPHENMPPFIVVNYFMKAR